MRIQPDPMLSQSTLKNPEEKTSELTLIGYLILLILLVNALVLHHVHVPLAALPPVHVRLSAPVHHIRSSGLVGRGAEQLVGFGFQLLGVGRLLPYESSLLNRKCKINFCVNSSQNGIGMVLKGSFRLVTICCENAVGQCVEKNRKLA